MKFICTCRKEVYLDCKTVHVLHNVCSATENYDHKWKSLTSITTDSVDNKLLQIGKLQQTIRIWIAHFTRNQISSWNPNSRHHRSFKTDIPLQTRANILSTSETDVLSIFLLIFDNKWFTINIKLSSIATKLLIHLNSSEHSFKNHK